MRVLSPSTSAPVAQRTGKHGKGGGGGGGGGGGVCLQGRGR